MSITPVPHSRIDCTTPLANRSTKVPHQNLQTLYSGNIKLHFLKLYLLGTLYRHTLFRIWPTFRTNIVVSDNVSSCLKNGLNSSMRLINEILKSFGHVFHLLVNIVFSSYTCRCCNNIPVCTYHALHFLVRYSCSIVALSVTIVDQIQRNNTINEITVPRQKFVNAKFACNKCYFLNTRIGCVSLQGRVLCVSVYI